MVRKIVWTLGAQKERVSILEYWNDRNQSNKYSKKLNNLIKESFVIISKFPQIGKKTDIENTRVKVLKDYLIFYEVTKSEIVVLTL